MRGIFQLIDIAINQSSKVYQLLFKTSSSQDITWLTILDSVKNSPYNWLNAILIILSFFILAHALIGVFYGILTEFSFKKMFKEKIGFHLQIISAVGAVFVVMSFMSSQDKNQILSPIAYIIKLLITLLGSYHIAKGFYNALITLGISVSKGTKTAAKIVAWLIAIISAIQIFILII